MNSSFYNGVSGIKTQQFAMDVQANNIANANTNGYKYSSPEISSLFSTALTGAYASYSNDKGLGAQSQTTALNLAIAWLCNWQTRDSVTPITSPISRKLRSCS